MWRHQEAAAHLEDTLQKFPGNLNAAKTMALAKMASHDLPGAEEVLKQAAASAGARFLHATPS